ncbi:MAG TPA: hypothetical protein VMV06_04185 [Acidimicrobiales bacterium]|nr:hypothetical protein [Acidimicrobiales bacterium]
MDEITVGAMPEGPWVVVMGMHRSGTSAVTGALGALGLNMPRAQDRIDSPTSNPEHWEIHSIMLHNDAILERLGGTWDAPPVLLDAWERGPELDDLADPTALLADAYPDSGPLAWKDPRVCILFPYWRQLLPAPLTVVFIWRSPFAVARSLRQRDGLQLLEGVSLWERYNRSALEGLRGADAYVIEYEALLADPMGSVGALTEWLRSLKQFSGQSADWDVGRAVAVIADGLQHQSSEGDDQVLLSSQKQLVDRLSALHGGHQPLEVEPDIVESEWATTLLEVRRQLNLELRNIEELELKRYRALLEFQAELARVNHVYEATVDQLNAERVRFEVESAQVKANYEAELARVNAELAKAVDWAAQMQSSTSWRLTKPLRSVAALPQRGSRDRQDPAVPRRE